MKPVGTTILGLVWIVLAAGLAGDAALPLTPAPAAGTCELPPALAERVSSKQQKPARPRHRESRRGQEPIILFTIR